MPVSSATSRTAVSVRVSPGSTCPLGRHHSRRPARLRRAMTAMRAAPSCTSMTTPPAERSSTAGRRRAGWRRSCRRRAHPPTITSAAVRADLSPAARRDCVAGWSCPLPLAGRRLPRHRTPRRPRPRAPAASRPGCRSRRCARPGAGASPLLRELGGSSRPPGTSSRWSAARCATPSSGGPAPTSTSRPRAPRADPAPSRGRGPTRRGTSAAPSARSGCASAGHPARGHDLPRRLLRPHDPQARGRLRRLAGRATSSGATSPSTRWRCGCRSWSSSTRTAGSPTSPPRSCAPRRPRRSPSPTTRCG